MGAQAESFGEASRKVRYGYVPVSRKLRSGYVQSTFRVRGSKPEDTR